MILRWRCWRKLFLLVFFPSILYGLAMIVWLTDKMQVKYYNVIAKVTDLIRWSQTVILAFIEHTHILIYSCLYIIYCITFLPLFMYHYFYYVHLENSSIPSHHFFTDVFGITWTIICSKKLQTLKTSDEYFWVILALILVLFLYLLRAVKSFLLKFDKMCFYYSNAYCTKQISQQVLL